MQLSLTDIILSDGTARAVCWTLVHSLWEGLLTAVLAGLVILCTRKLPARLRYNLLATDLLLFLLAAGTTFFYELRQEARQPTTGVDRIVVEGADKKVPGTPGTGKGIASWQQEISLAFNRPESFIRQAGDYLNTHATVVTLVWLACLLGQLLRLTGGLYQVRRLRRSSIPPPGEYWNERLLVLSRRLDIRRTVRLLQSGLAKAPVAFGFLKPSILVPLGMLSNLPPDQVETILLHELAHIRRSDYIANLLLHITEAIFFFNPGIRWVGSLIRQEREACCDDIVLAGVPDRNSYFEALLAFKQWVIDGRFAGEGTYTLQLGGGKTDLIWRIRRMLDQENKKLHIMEKAILSFGLMAIVSVSLISMKERSGQTTNPVIPIRSIAQVPVPGTAPAPVLQTKTDTVPRKGEYAPAEKNVIIRSISSHTDSHDGQKKYNASAIDDNGNRYKIKKVNDEVTEFKVNDKLIAKEDYWQYTSVFASIEEDAITHNQVLPPPQASSMPATSPLPAVSVSPAVSRLPTVVLTPIPPTAPATSSMSASASDTRVDRNRPITVVGHAVAPDHRLFGRPTVIVDRPAESENPPTLENPLVYTRQPNVSIRGIAADLVKDRLIDHVEEFSFTLDADKLLVNGTQQPEDVFLRFKTKYVIHARDHFIYSQYWTSHGSGSHCEVKDDDTSSSTDRN
jgi:beta-lactamase regulating signal transducer with metallopeptidase domain